MYIFYFVGHPFQSADSGRGPGLSPGCGGLGEGEADCDIRDPGTCDISSKTAPSEGFGSSSDVSHLLQTLAGVVLERSVL